MGIIYIYLVSEKVFLSFLNYLIIITVVIIIIIIIVIVIIIIIIIIIATKIMKKGLLPIFPVHKYSNKSYQCHGYAGQ